MSIKLSSFTSMIGDVSISGYLKGTMPYTAETTLSQSIVDAIVERMVAGGLISIGGYPLIAAEWHVSGFDMSIDKYIRATLVAYRDGSGAANAAVVYIKGISTISIDADDTWSPMEWHIHLPPANMQDDFVKYSNWADSLDLPYLEQLRQYLMGILPYNEQWQPIVFS